MKIRPEQLMGTLRSEQKPLYWIAGDEPLLIEESASLARNWFKEAHFTEREIFDVERGFKWEQFNHAVNNLSLFSEKKIFDVRLQTSKLEKDSKEAVSAFLNINNPDLVLLIRSPKLESTQLNSKWFKSIISQVVIVQVWPVGRENLGSWLSNRLIKEGINPDKEALRLLTDKVEGNLLAAIQEIEKLKLLANKQGQPINLDADTAMQVIADSSRYTAYNLIDSALLGDSVRSMKILINLKAEGTYPLIILGAITRELRILLPLVEEKELGSGINGIIESNRVWFNRKKAVGSLLQRCTSQQLWKMLARSQKIDQAIKGASSSNPWDELNFLILELCGKNISY
jgi:DNA polymerase-3 subunit delta